MARLATLTKGTRESFERNPSACRLVHSRFTPLADKLAMVKTWPGINPDAVDGAFATAQENGTIAGYNVEVDKNPLLDNVIVVYRESLPATLIYACERMKEAWGDEYCEWAEAYAQNVDENRVQAIPNAKPFIPNQIVIEVVDFGANWDRKSGTVVETVQKAQAGQLADFAVIYNAIQSPKWVEQMDGVNVPYAFVAALLLSVPAYDSWRYSPHVWRGGGKALLHGSHVESHFSYAMPVFRRYGR